MEILLRYFENEYFKEVDLSNDLGIYHDELENASQVVKILSAF